MKVVDPLGPETVPAGLSVTLIERDPAAMQAAEARVQDLIRKAEARGKATPAQTARREQH